VGHLRRDDVAKPGVQAPSDSVDHALLAGRVDVTTSPMMDSRF